MIREMVLRWLFKGQVEVGGGYVRINGLTAGRWEIPRERRRGNEAGGIIEGKGGGEEREESPKIVE